ncbi:hypothetical protein [Streptomyces sp. NPDC005732]
MTDGAGEAAAFALTDGVVSLSGTARERGSGTTPAPGDIVSPEAGSS